MLDLFSNKFSSQLSLAGGQVVALEVARRTIADRDPIFQLRSWAEGPAEDDRAPEVPGLVSVYNNELLRTSRMFCFWYTHIPIHNVNKTCKYT